MVYTDRRISSAVNTSNSSGCATKLSCDTCNQQFPACAWCASTAACLPATDELIALYQRSTSHVFYSHAEYTRTYRNLDPKNHDHLLLSSECPVWVVSSQSCSHINQYCQGSSQCGHCIRYTGCGWCHQGNKCLPGTVSSDLVFHSQTAFCPPSEWAFLDWPRYFQHRIIDLSKCEAPSAKTPVQYAPAPPPPYQPSSNQNSAFGLDNSHDSSTNNNTVEVMIIMFVALGMVVCAIASILLSLRRAEVPSPQSTAAPDHSSSRNANPVDFQALETQFPFCRPFLLSDAHLRNRAFSDSRDVDLEREGTDLSHSTTASSALACAVCLADMEKGEEGRYLPCKHLFHRHCVDAWLSKSRQCPVCRRMVPRTGVPTASERIMERAEAGGLGISRLLARGTNQEENTMNHESNAAAGVQSGSLRQGQESQPRSPLEASPSTPPESTAGDGDEASENIVSTEIALEGVPSEVVNTNHPRQAERSSPGFDGLTSPIVDVRAADVAIGRSSDTV